MSNISFSEVRGNVLGLTAVAGRLTFNSGTPTIAEGRGFTVDKTAAGVYTITFAQKYPGVVAAFASVHAADGSLGADKALVAGIKSVSGSPVDLSAKTLKISVRDAAGAIVTTELTTTESLSFLVLFRNTSVS
jgi:hypothetical protein